MCQLSTSWNVNILIGLLLSPREQGVPNLLMGCISKPHYSSIWNAGCIFPQKCCCDYSLQRGLLNSSSLTLLHALPLWLDSCSSLLLERSVPLYPKPTHALDNQLKCHSTKILSTDGWITGYPELKRSSWPFCSGRYGYFPSISDLPLPNCGNHHRLGRLHPPLFPGAWSVPVRITPSLLTWTLVQAIQA